MSLNAPTATSFRPKPREAGEEDASVASSLATPTPTDTDDDVPAPIPIPIPSEPDPEPPVVLVDEQKQKEEDEVKIAWEMAMAAAKNPHMSVDELRKMVASSSETQNKQAEIVEQVQQKQLEEKSRRWNERKGMITGWMSSKAGTVTAGVSAAKMVAVRRSKSMQEFQDRRLYAASIQNDEKYQELRKNIAFTQKLLKANRLEGNRVETEHSFKRQRQGKKLAQLNDKIEKQLILFNSSSYYVQEYAKAVMRASKKWNRKQDDEELALEAQLCRNMHQMLAIEKQKSKLKKSTKEMKKYLQRCRGWLSNKKANCDMHMMTMEGTSGIIVSMYEDILKTQDELVKRLKESDEFKEVDLESVELRPSWMELNSLEQQDEALFDGPTATVATLAALRGLPISKTLRLRQQAIDKEKARQEEEEKQQHQAEMKAPPAEGAGTAAEAEAYPDKASKEPELVIETKKGDGEGSVCSHLSDPDEFGNGDDVWEDAPWLQEDKKEEKEPTTSSKKKAGRSPARSNSPLPHSPKQEAVVDRSQ